MHTATLLKNGNVLITGGECEKGGFTSGAELYNPAINKWTDAGNMKTERTAHTSTLLLDGRVLITGGWKKSNYGNIA